MPSGKELRYRILQYLLAKEHSGDSSLADEREIAIDLSVTEQDIIDQIDILESKGAIVANRTFTGAAPMLTRAGKALLEELEKSLDERRETETFEEIVNVRPEYVRPSPGEFEWDVFICHATEDKDIFVRKLAGELAEKGIRVWYDEFALTVGDSLRESIDKGILKSRFGIVVLSPSFFNKNWPQRELNALTARDSRNQKVILPIWLNVDRAVVYQHSPLLADIYAARAEEGIEKVVNELMRVFK